MKKRLISKILMAPLIILVILAFFVGIYAAYSKIYNIGWETPIILGIILLL